MITNQKDARSDSAVFAIAVFTVTVTFATAMEMGFAVNVVVVGAIVEVVIADESKRSYPFRVNLGQPSLSRAARDGNATVAGKFG